MNFSTMLRKLREEKHLSQKDIAAYLGITRQAVTAYELAKREPDHDILKKLADFYNVSVDYLLGRALSKDVNALIIGSNIELIKGNLSYKELSERINQKTGAVIFPEMLELYVKGERTPFIGTIKILTGYACVPESFFYKYNTMESYQNERELYRKEIEQDSSYQKLHFVKAIPGVLENSLVHWITDENNLPYIKIGKELQEAGLTVDMLKPFIESAKMINNNHKRII